jgi:branched-chain amino acid transport system ATP-binding protein
MLEVSGLLKAFGNLRAVDGVDLAIEAGTITGLIGPNGAGKTTCFNLLTHFLTPTRGRIRFKGREITGSRPADIARLGLVRSFQISAVFLHLSVLENVRVALQRKLGTSFHFWRSERTLDSLNEQALALLREVDLESYADTLTVELAYGRKRALEIATTLAMEPELMLLDEPTQGMGHEDVGRIAAGVSIGIQRTNELARAAEPVSRDLGEGDLLFIEVVSVPGKGQLLLTGQLPLADLVAVALGEHELAQAQATVRQRHRADPRPHEPGLR